MAQRLFVDRDWMVHELNAGTSVADFLVSDPDSRIWLVEVKNTKSITEAHKKQAIQQAAKKKLPWLLASKISGSSSWLIQRQGHAPTVWREQEPAGETPGV